MAALLVYTAPIQKIVIRSSLAIDVVQGVYYVAGSLTILTAFLPQLFITPLHAVLVAVELVRILYDLVITFDAPEFLPVDYNAGETENWGNRERNSPRLSMISWSNRELQQTVAQGELVMLNKQVKRSLGVKIGIVVAVSLAFVISCG